MSALFITVLVLMGVAQVFVITRVVRRVMVIQRMLRDPAQLRQMLSPATREALREAGFDPDALRIEQIQKSPELGRLVAADLRRLVGQGLLDAFRPRSPAAVAHPAPPMASDGSFDPSAAGGPLGGAGEPIGPSGSTLRVVAVFALLAAAAAALVLKAG